MGVPVLPRDIRNQYAERAVQCDDNRSREDVRFRRDRSRRRCLQAAGGPRAPESVDGQADPVCAAHVLRSPSGEVPVCVILPPLFRGEQDRSAVRQGLFPPDVRLRRMERAVIWSLSGEHPGRDPAGELFLRCRVQHHEGHSLQCREYGEAVRNQRVAGDQPSDYQILCLRRYGLFVQPGLQRREIFVPDHIHTRRPVPFRGRDAAGTVAEGGIRP